MALKAVLASLDEVPEALRSLYVEKDGKFLLDVEGVVPKERLDEFRTTNVNLLKERDALKAQVEKYKDIDPEKARTALTQLQKIEEGKLLTEGKLDEVVTKRTEAMRAEYENQIKALKTAQTSVVGERDTLSGQLSKLLIDGSAREIALKLGARPEALPFILLKSAAEWQMKDGKPTPIKDGNLVYGKDGQTPITMEEWVGGLATEAAYLFKDSNGGGANNKPNGSSVTGGRVSVRDQQALNSNIEAIAQGKVQVVQ